MNSKQVESMIPHLKAGSSYLFEHMRKGTFVAVYKGTRPTKPSDEVDTIFIEVDIYTEDGSGQERLANTFARDEMGRKMRPKYESRFIRPSLLRSITTPSTVEQRRLTEQFLAVREKPEMAPLSLPTEQAFRTLGEPEAEQKKPGLWKRLVGY